MRDNRTKHQRAAAAKRLGEDQRTLRMETIAESLGVSFYTVRGWACAGKRGVHLDALFTNGEWFSSWKAVERFKQATEATPSASLPLPTGEAVSQCQQLLPLSPRDRSDTRAPAASLSPQASA